MREAIVEAVAKEFGRAGFRLNDDQVGAFAEYAALLDKWNARMNLTSVRDPDETINAHFVDSCLALRHVEIASGARIADIGSGAGFPGVPIAIVRPDAQVTLIEADGRKASFLHTARSALRLGNLSIAAKRVEPESVPDAWVGLFDGVVSRYTASVEWVSNCARAMTRPGGWCVIHKYDDDDEREALARVGAWPDVVDVRWESDEHATPRRRFACVKFAGDAPKEPEPAPGIARTSA